MQQSKVKLTGKRSIESKLHRLAYELENDAARIKADHPHQVGLYGSVREISRLLGMTARSIEE